MFDAAYPPPIIGGKEKQAHLLARELVWQGREFKLYHIFIMGITVKLMKVFLSNEYIEEFFQLQAFYSTLSG